MYTVRWMPLANEQLLQITLAPGETKRSHVLAIVKEIDKLLAEDPTEVGESRDGDRRVLIVPPLGVEYRVRTADQEVRVARVWRFAVGTGS